MAYSCWHDLGRNRKLFHQASFTLLRRAILAATVTSRSLANPTPMCRAIDRNLLHCKVNEYVAKKGNEQAMEVVRVERTAYCTVLPVVGRRER
jgi:hypothetical protein